VATIVGVVIVVVVIVVVCKLLFAQNNLNEILLRLFCFVDLSVDAVWFIG